MKKNFTHDILSPSLELIRSDSKIKKFFFLPGMFSVVIMSLILVYQVVYTYVVLLQKPNSIMQVILNFFHNSEYLIASVIIICIGFVIYVIAGPVLDGALIRYIATRDEKGPDSASRADSLGIGFVRFYPIFEFNSISGLFKFVSIFNAFLFSLRFLGISYITPLAILFFIAFLFSMVLNLFIAYARYEIILHDTGVFEAIGVSARITLTNIDTTIRIYFLMFIMNIKVFLNFIIFMIFPIMGVAIAGFITSQVFSFIIFVVLVILFIFLLMVLGYTTGVLDIFRTSIWYYAYKQGKEKLEETDTK